MNRTMILVVDDDPRIVRFVSANLKAEGYEVASASDGRTALEVIAQQEPALVILDLAMPELDGPGVLDRLRLESPTPVIVLSALGRDQDKVRALDLGADAAPYFRVFNPILQSCKFDPYGDFVRAWIPELRRVPDEFIHEPWKMPDDVQRKAHCIIGKEYPAPIINHAFARARVLDAYRMGAAAG